MIFTVAVVVADSEAFVDPRLDSATPIIRDVFGATVRDRDSFELVGVRAAPQSVEEIRTAVTSMMEGGSVDWILVVGGIGFERRDCTPEVCRRSTREKSN